MSAPSWALLSAMLSALLSALLTAVILMSPPCLRPALPLEMCVP
jgi:hypothetical protein